MDRTLFSCSFAACSLSRACFCEGGLPAYRLLVGFHVLAHPVDLPVVPVELEEVFQSGDAFGRYLALHPDVAVLQVVVDAVVILPSFKIEC